MTRAMSSATAAMPDEPGASGPATSLAPDNTAAGVRAAADASERQLRPPGAVFRVGLMPAQRLGLRQVDHRDLGEVQLAQGATSAIAASEPAGQRPARLIRTKSWPKTGIRLGATRSVVTTAGPVAAGQPGAGS